MRSLTWCGVAVALVLAACSLLPGGGGGGGGGSTFTFSNGFATVRKDTRNLYVTDLADPNAPLQLSTTGGVSMPSFSRDGRQVVFARRIDTESELIVVPATGGTATAVLRSTVGRQNLRAPVFSPDGATIAFVFDDNPPSSSVGLVGVDGSNFRKLIGGGALAYASPSFFPDGKSVLVSAANSGLLATQIERVDLTTGMPASVTNTLGDALGIASRVLVSPDGARAVFDGRVSSGATRIFVIDLSTKAVARQRDASGSVNDSAPCWVNATTFAFSSDEGGNDQVYRQQVGSANVTLVVPLAIEPAFGQVAASADGGIDGGSSDGGSGDAGADGGR